MCKDMRIVLPNDYGKLSELKLVKDIIEIKSVYVSCKNKLLVLLVHCGKTEYFIEYVLFNCINTKNWKRCVIVDRRRLCLKVNFRIVPYIIDKNNRVLEYMVMALCCDNLE